MIVYRKAADGTMKSNATRAWVEEFFTEAQIAQLKAGKVVTKGAGAMKAQYWGEAHERKEEDAKARPFLLEQLNTLRRVRGLDELKKWNGPTRRLRRRVVVLTERWGAPKKSKKRA